MMLAEVLVMGALPIALTNAGSSALTTNCPAARERGPRRLAEDSDHQGPARARPDRAGRARSPVALLAQLTPHRPSGEDRAVDVHVVGRRILPDRLDEAAIDPGGASADGVRSTERAREQGDDHRPGYARRPHVDVGSEHRAVDVLPANVEAH